MTKSYRGGDGVSTYARPHYEREDYVGTANPKRTATRFDHDAVSETPPPPTAPRPEPEQDEEE